MTTSIQNLINAAYCNAGSKMNFNIMFNDIFGVAHRFYFYGATLEKYSISVFESWKSSNPKELQLVSASGLILNLRLEAIVRNEEMYKIQITNPHKKEIRYSHGIQRLENKVWYSCKEADITFWKV